MARSEDTAAFVKAVRRGEAESVRSMAKGDSSLLAATDPDSFGATPLIHAVRNDDAPMVDLLL